MCRCCISLESPSGTFAVSELRPQSIDVDEVTREYFARIHRAALVLTGSPWDADDLADLLAIGLDGHREPGWLTCMKLKVTGTESSRVQMANKAVMLTLEQTTILKHGN